MKIDAPDIDHARLLELISAEYDVALTSLRFVPRGEEAYTYIAHAPAGQPFFVRVQPTSPARALEQAYAISHVLHNQYGLRQVVAPLATHRDTYTIQWGKYTVAVFPFIEGTTLHQRGVINESLQATAALVAALHECQPAAGTLPLNKETFGNPFTTAIGRALAVAQAPPVGATSYQHGVCRLLRTERADILATCDRMEWMQRQAQTLVSDWVVTHGDPTPANFLKDSSETLHLTDWGEMALSPPERDLSLFTGDNFDVFLQHYARIRPDCTLHHELFAFYFYRWTMQEIADYATRILFRQLGPAEDEHAWAELQAYLPIRHADIAEGVQRVQNLIERI